MKVSRKVIAIGMCGIVLGITGSVMSVPTASARFYSCDQRIENMEKSSAKDYKKGKLSAEDYAKVQAEIAYHRVLWGC